MYEKILQCRPKYPSTFDSSIRDLLRHLLTSDLSARYGNLRRGCLDVMEHKWFESIDFKLLAQRKVTPPYAPTCKGDGDSSLFDVYEEQQVPYGVPQDDPYRHLFEEF